MIDALDVIRITLTIVFVVATLIGTYLSYYRRPTFMALRPWLLAVVSVSGIGAVGLMIAPIFI